MLLQTQKPILRPQTTAHLAQTMALLEMTNAELCQKIESALAANPALEVVSPARCPSCHRAVVNHGVCPSCQARPAGGQPIVFVSPRRDFWRHEGSTCTDEGEEQGEEWNAEVEDLPTFVAQQIAPELAPRERMIAAHLLSSLDDDGLLTVNLLEVARYHHVSLQEVQRVQRLIQQADPLGVGSTSPQEALLVQLEALREVDPPPPKTEQAILWGMEALSRRAYGELARLLGISVEEARRLAQYIGEKLNPFPARAYWGDVRHRPATFTLPLRPDILISRLTEEEDTPLIVEIISPYAGTLRVSPTFRRALSEAPAEKREGWRQNLEEALLLVKCLQQRDHTLVRLMQRLVVIQREYVLHGEAYLKPLTRAQIAEELEVHESTISRAVAGKAVQLPSGKVVPLARWFDRSLNVRTALLKIIAEEQQPLSDAQIARLLARQGFQVARRTVAKYRSMEGILSARMRRHAVKTSAHG